jgi:sec-independent protein translocase protein TatB
MEAEVLFILLLALIVLGPRRLPEIGRQIGKALAELRRAKYEFTRQIEDEIRKIEEEEEQRTLEPEKTEASGEVIASADGEEERKILPPAAAVARAGAANSLPEMGATVTSEHG